MLGSDGASLLGNLDKLHPRQLKLLELALSGDRIAQYWLCPWRVMASADPWQRRALIQLVTRQENVLMCCTRGGGKTETFAAAAYLEACTGGFAMILSRSNRQAMRIISRAWLYSKRMALVPLESHNMHELVFSGGGRILALPCSGDTIVGEHGVTLMGLDEAARIKDDFYAVVTPMLIVSEKVTGIKARLALLSTPFGRRGFFYKEWVGEGDEGWVRHRYTWRECPRITRSDIERERRRHDELYIRQEYECEFLAQINQLFDVPAWQELVDENEQAEEMA